MIIEHSRMRALERSGLPVKESAKVQIREPITDAQPGQKIEAEAIQKDRQIKSDIEGKRLQTAISILNKDQRKVVCHLWDKYKNLDQFQGTVEMKAAGVTGYSGFSALFLSTKNKQHEDFYRNTFISKNNPGSSIKIKGYYMFSVTFQGQILTASPF